MLVNRHGVVAKGQAPHGGRRADLARVALGAVVVLAVGLGLSSLSSGQPGAGAPAGGSTAKQAHPTTALGDVSSFAVIATDVQHQVAHNDINGADRGGSESRDSAEVARRPG